AGLSDLVFLPDGKTLITVGDDTVLRFWDLAAGKGTRTIRLQGNMGPGYCQTLSPDGKLLVALCGTELQFWDATTGKEIKKLALGSPGLSYMYFSPDGRHLAVGSGDAKVTLFEWQKGAQQQLTIPALIGA